VTWFCQVSNYRNLRETVSLSFIQADRLKGSWIGLACNQASNAKNHGVQKLRACCSSSQQGL
jgi:hypothetical protein